MFIWAGMDRGGFGVLDGIGMGWDGMAYCISERCVIRDQHKKNV